MRILVVEDNTQISDIIRRGLAEEGYIVDTASDSDEAEALCTDHVYDVMILDLILPGKDGLEFCKSLREKDDRTRILMLTARTKLQNKIAGFEAGADDYLTKPFAFDELSVRIRALLKREATRSSPVLRHDNLTLDTATGEVRQHEKQVKVTRLEYSLLEYFMLRPGALITKRMIEDDVLNEPEGVVSNAVEVLVSRLREKIKTETEDPIETLRGRGYRLKPL